MPLYRSLIQFWPTVLWSTLIKKVRLKKWNRDIRGRLLSSPETLELMDVLYAMNTYVTHPRASLG